MIAEHPVELATLPDARQIAEMSRDYIEYGLPWGWSEARVAGAIRNPDANVAVVREGDRVAGFGIMGYTDEDAHLLLLAVRHDRRRLGIASAPLAWLEQSARAAVQPGSASSLAGKTRRRAASTASMLTMSAGSGNACTAALSTACSSKSGCAAMPDTCVSAEIPATAAVMNHSSSRRDLGCTRRTAIAIGIPLAHV